MARDNGYKKSKPKPLSAISQNPKNCCNQQIPVNKTCLFCRTSQNPSFCTIGQFCPAMYVCSAMWAEPCWLLHCCIFPYGPWHAVHMPQASIICSLHCLASLGGQSHPNWESGATPPPMMRKCIASDEAWQCWLPAHSLSNSSLKSSKSSELLLSPTTS